MSKGVFEELLKQLDIVEEGAIRVSDLKAAYNAGMTRAAEICQDCDISPSQADSNGSLTNAQDRWVMGTFDASEQIAAAIRAELGKGEKGQIKCHM